MNEQNESTQVEQTPEASQRQLIKRIRAWQNRERRRRAVLVLLALVIGLLAGRVLPAVAEQARPSYDDQKAARDKAHDELLDELSRTAQPYPKVVDVMRNSVVHIKVKRTVKPGQNPGGPGGRRFPFPFPFPFDDDQMPAPRQPQQRDYTQEGAGSGVIIDRLGHILTNNHVVGGADADGITVVLYDGQEYDAKLVGADPKTDLALIKIDAKNLLPAMLGNSDDLKMGQEVMAFGSPYQIRGSVSRGIISGLNRRSVRLPGGSMYPDFIQTDAAINPGNSGGPLVNLRGEVIGINTAITTRTGGFQGIGWAIPINQYKEIAEQLRKGKVVRGFLGIKMNLDEDIVKKFGAEHGVLVDEVYPGTPADKGGLKSGDVITSINGNKMADPDQLRFFVAGLKPGEKAEMQVVRDGKQTKVTIVIGEQPSDMARLGQDAPGDDQSAESTKLGLTVQTLTPDLARKLNIKAQGVLITEVTPGSPAAEAGLAPGMVIQEVAHKPVKTVAEYRKALDDAPDKDDGILMHVRDRTGARYVVVK